ncbi:MAG: LTA synthase family protein [Anaerovorax sp.]
MKMRVKKMWVFLREFPDKYMHNSLTVCVVLSLVLNFTIESISRRSPLKCFVYIFDSPMTFLFNALIIGATLSVAFLVKRRIFIYLVVSVVWLGLGITNGVILGFRTTPFTVTDLSLADAGLSIITNYMSIPQIALIVAAVILAAAIFVLVFIFAPKHNRKTDYRKSIAGLLILALVVTGTTNVAIDRGWVSTYFGNLNYAYRDYGFPYCFINTWLNTGIKSPNSYSPQLIEGIFTPEELTTIREEVTEKQPQGANVKTPNIIMLQLESFFDPLRMTNLTFSEDPIPYFRELRDKYSSGFLVVPSIGAGTANTEFESITGMCVRFFGPGEYPYKSILTKKTCTSVCYDLKELGYATHAIHNHRGAFYGRNSVFPNLGFDTFTSLEYMNNVRRTPKNWAKDDILTTEIMNALNATKSEDFIYTISVQGHGQYPTKEYPETPKITVSGLETDSQTISFEYYLEQIKEMDDFVKDLTQTLENYDEDVVLVMYGDHLPGLPITDETLKDGNIYNSEYVLWSNFKMEEKDKDLHAYQLSAEILDRLGINQGIMTKYHQNHKEDKTYLENLKALQYDMLYGNDYVFQGKNPYKATKLKMGVNDIKIDEVLKIGKKYYLKGENFTTFSKVSLDGEVLDTIFLGPTTLGLLEDVDPKDASKMKVSQVEKNKEILSTTE